MAKRKMNPNSLKNLEKGHPFNKETASIAKQKSDAKKKENKTLAQLLEIALKLPDEETGEVKEISMTNAIITKAIKGDVAAFLAIRDTMGQKPVEQKQIIGGDLKLEVHCDND